MHLEHKPGETMQVDWAGQTAALVDTDTWGGLYLDSSGAAQPTVSVPRGAEPSHP